MIRMQRALVAEPDAQYPLTLDLRQIVLRRQAYKAVRSHTQVRLGEMKGENGGS